MQDAPIGNIIPADRVFEMILDAQDGHSGEAIAQPSLSSGELWRDGHEEGQLAVDVADAGDSLVVVSTMAGAPSDRVEVYIHNDMLTIRGVRQSPLAGESITRYYCEECFWGAFSRTIVLPAHVQGDLARAQYQGGVLMIRVPKKDAQARIPIIVVDDE